MSQHNPGPYSMRQAAPLQPTMPLIPDEANLTSHHNTAGPSPPDRLPTRNLQSSSNTPHSRDVSAARGRIDGPAALGVANFQNQQRRGQSHSKSPESIAGRSGLGYEEGLERRPSNSYEHHRQTSIVHGVQHSRNPSFATSSTTATASQLTPDNSSTVSFGSGAGSAGASADSMLAGKGGKLEQSDVPPNHPHAGNNGSTHGQPMGLITVEDNVPNDGLDVNLTQRKIPPNTKPRAVHTHTRSRSKHHQEARTVGEYALHHLFNSFVGQADNKINQCIMSLGEYDQPVEQVCGPGADPTFDQLISALGHIARQKPKPLIDTIMFWRKAKGEASIVAKQMMNQQSRNTPWTGGLPRRNTDNLQTINDLAGSPSAVSNAPLSLGSRHEDVVLAERRATVSVYLVCRVLIEIFHQSSLAAITSEMADRLEDIVFIQLKSVDPDQISSSSLKMANWRIYAQLLGIMSDINFSSVSNRFLAELDRFQKDATRGAASNEAEARAELLAFGMRHLRIRTQPEEAWVRTCEFMRSMAGLFVNSHGPRIKQAYCGILERLILPIAENPQCDLASPKWKEFLDILAPRLSQMLTKPRHWASGFPLHILLLCVSPREVFSPQWLSVATSLPPKLKDRPTRGPALQALCRLVWTYLFRYPDSTNVALRRVDEVIRFALPAGRRTYLSTEPAFVEPLILFIRMIGFKHPDLCFRSVIFPLINSDLFASGKELKIEQMEPDKMVIGIRSFLAIMSDLENGNQSLPPFPQSFATSFGDAASNSAMGPPQLLSDSGSPRLMSSKSSCPVDTSNFSDAAKEYYVRFCEILGKITILCDNTFGGQAALDEKLSGLTPKTPISEAFSFGRRDDHQNGPDQKQSYYDLFHVAVQALPRCLSVHIPFNSLINLLCTGTAHVQSNIAVSSASSLKSIARQSHAQQVTIRFARFIFNFDARYSTMSEEGLLGPDHIESTLKLYVELLHIWIEEIKQKTKDATTEPSEKSGTSGSRALQLDLSGVLAHVEEIESHGLFFLCSQSRRVRSFAITVLQLVTEFDEALGKENARVIRILERDSQKILDLNYEQLNVAERSRLQKGKRRNSSQSTLIELCSSEVSYDSTLWSKVFPNLIRVCYDTCPFAVALGREIVCARLVQMHDGITALAENVRTPQYPASDVAQERATVGGSSTSPEIMIEQWKLYLVMACTTLNSAGAQSQSQIANAQHARKASKGTQQTQDKISSARSLFAFVIPLLSAGPASIRNAIVAALGSINKNLYRTLLESLQYAVTTCNEHAKVRIGAHYRTPSSPQRNRRTDRLRTEVTHVYKLTSHVLKEPEVFNDDWIVNNLVTYTKDLRIFLSDVEVQNDLEFQRLRFHYCGLMEELYEGLNRSGDPSRWVPFESRKSAFSLMEDWCGYSPNQAQIAQREEGMRKMALSQQHENGEVRNNAAIEIEKKDLRTAALSAMASLCGGPISITTESKSILQFDIRRMLSWIDTIFNTVSDKLHSIGRRALKNLITHNKEYPYLLERSIEMCYLSERPKALESYFEVVTQVLIEHTDYPLAFWRILGAVLFTLGNEKREIRMKSARLLRTLEERQQKNSKLQDFDISISDKTTAVYKLAQFETSKRVAKQHADLAFTIFSEFSLHFKSLQPDSQRNMVAAILPWVQSIELQLDPNGGPTGKSYMLLANLFEITIRCSTALPNQVQALWQALATGPHGGNVQLILDFIICLCLDRKEQNFVDYAKQIVVFLSTTPAGSKVIEFFLLQVVPKNMVHDKKDIVPPPPEMKGLPYVADLGIVLPVGNKQGNLSLGQVSLIFLVDLMVAPVTLNSDNVIKLLHVALILWDHYTLAVQEQAREMLVHLIHEVVAAKIEDETPGGTRQSIEDFVESIRKNDATVIWDYEDNNGNDADEEGSRVPAAMTRVTQEVMNFFGIAYEGLSDLWAKEALNWATSCPVRHLACRSFQVFRCISTSLDSRMLADMLARLSNTIAEEETDYQTFSMEILTTLKIIISSLSPPDLMRYPQLFWTTCACLNTIHEREFMESLGMLEKYLDKVDMGDPAVVFKFKESQPSKWEGNFDGIQVLVYKGIKSSQSLEKTMALLHRLSAIPDNELVGSEERLLFAVLANLPQFSYQFDLVEKSPTIIDRACLLAKVAEQQGCPHLANSMNGFANGQYRTEQDFLDHAISAIRSYYFPEHDVQSLVFVMGLLTNTTTWFRVKTMKILGLVISEIDMRRPEVACHGPDLISPLLRLLQTELCPQALGVMDHIMMVCGNPMEKHHIRMSMASSSSSRAIRKEYDRTQSLYGIPEATGWSIPMPAAQSSMTRNNVHAVFYTCAEADRMEAPRAGTPDMEFHADEYSDSFFPTLRADTMKSIDTQHDGNMGDIVQKLDSLDDFFEETEIHPASMVSTESNLHRYGNDFQDVSAHLYDEETAPILRKSLARTASTSSFHNGLAESRPSTSRPEGSGSNLASLHPTFTGGDTLRPSMHIRSVTSPSNNLFPASIMSMTQITTPPDTHSGSNFFFSEEDMEGALSDSDDRLTLNHPSTSAGDGASRTGAVGSMIRSTKSGMRRLTGNNAANRDRERQRDFLRAQHRAVAQTANSPRVPRVPPEYLVGPGSSPGSPGQ